MAKKTCKDCVGYNYCSDYEKYDDAFVQLMPDGEDVSTECSQFKDAADVVPRSEVEKAKQEVTREIFEKIDNLIITLEIGDNEKASVLDYNKYSELKKNKLPLKVTKCKGEGHGSCRRCTEKGKWNRMWMCFLYKIEGYDGCYCSECVKELQNEQRTGGE